MFDLARLSYYLCCLRGFIVSCHTSLNVELVRVYHNPFLADSSCIKVSAMKHELKNDLVNNRPKSQQRLLGSLALVSTLYFLLSGGCEKCAYEKETSCNLAQLKQHCYLRLVFLALVHLHDQ